MGPVGGQEPRASPPAPDAAPAVAFPLSTPSSSASWLGSRPLSFHTRHPAYPTQSISRALLPAAPTLRPTRWVWKLRAGLVVPVGRDAVAPGAVLQSLLPFLSWPADLAWHTSDGDFLGSPPFRDTGPFHHSRERLKPGTKKKCRGSKATVSPFSPVFSAGRSGQLSPSPSRLSVRGEGKKEAACAQYRGERLGLASDPLLVS